MQPTAQAVGSTMQDGTSPEWGERRIRSSDEPYSCRNASIGFNREARNAGIIPLTNPTTPRIIVDAINVPGAIINRISPASPFFANALYNVSRPTESATT